MTASGSAQNPPNSTLSLPTGILVRFTIPVSGKPQERFVSTEGSLLGLMPLLAWPCSDECGTTHGHIVTGDNTLIVLTRPPLAPFVRDPITHLPVVEDSTMSPPASPLRLFNKQVLYPLPSLHHVQTGMISIL